MTAIYGPSVGLVLASLCLFIAIGATWRGGQLLVQGLRHAHHPAGALWLVRGIRGVIVAVGMAALGGGVLLTSKGLLVFGAIFLGEELYETGVLLLALRAGLKATKEQPSVRRNALDGHGHHQG